jgi:hypothetical protein
VEGLKTSSHSSIILVRSWIRFRIKSEKFDPDPLHSGKLDPDPHHSAKLYPDPHKSEKLDPVYIKMKSCNFLCLVANF